MSAHDQALEFYSRHPGHDLARDLLHYSRIGYAYCSPGCIILAELKRDSWHIHFACGTGALARFFAICPEYRPMVTFARPDRGRNFLHYYSFTKLKKHALYALKKSRAPGKVSFWRWLQQYYGGERVKSAHTV